MDKNKLMQLLKKEEGPKLDFKAELKLATESDKKELTKDVIAIANSRRGRGYIIFGIEDKTKAILGLEHSDYLEEQIQQIIYNRCDPPVPISIDYVEIEDKLVAVLTIFSSNHQPHQMLQSGAFFIRRGSTTDTARRSEIANMFQENGLMSYETVVLPGASLDDLDFELIRHYFSRLNVNGDPSEILLEAMGIIGKNNYEGCYSPTIGGMLLFGRNTSLLLPHVYVRINFQGREEVIYGNIPVMLEKVCSIIASMAGPGYPVEAVNEIIANALVHRDYIDNTRGTQIIIDSGKMEVINPGALIAENSVYSYIKEKFPSRRNPWLYQRVLALDSGERLMKSDYGLKRISKAFYGIGKVKFVNLGSQNLFKVILPAPQNTKI